PGQAHTVQINCRSARVGQVNLCARLLTEERLEAEKCAVTQITTPQLKLTMTGPESALVGAPVNYRLVVSNPGSGPATNGVLNAAFDPGLVHASGSKSLSLPIGTLAGGAERQVDLQLTAQAPGRLTTGIMARGDGNLTAQASHAVNVIQAKLTAAIAGPKTK